jgi:hypothetical protein
MNRGAGYPRSFRSTKYPDTIRQASILQSVAKPKKIFRYLGLKNDSIQLTYTGAVPKEFRSKCQLNFSADGNKGYWDIATMSMRGIGSCMTWTKRNSRTLVGSLIDPYVGLIYISDDTKLKHGSRMLARSVVRFVVNVKLHRPALLLEQVYLATHIRMAATTSDTMRISVQNVSDTFKHYLTTKVPDIDIVYVDKSQDDLDRINDTYRIPFSRTTNQLNALAQEHLSYRDSTIQYANIADNASYTVPDRYVEAKNFIKSVEPVA